MIVCVCHNVSERDIARATAGGCSSFSALQHSLKVGTGCGACTECALQAFHAHANAQTRCGEYRREIPVTSGALPAAV